MTDTETDNFGPGREIKHTIVGEQTWDELLPRFEEWLRGVGYIFDGTVEVVCEHNDD